MKLKQLTFRKIRRLQAFMPVLVVGVLMVTGAVIYNFNARAATAGFYFTSGATSYRVGDTFTVTVRENSGADCANVVQADFTYPANLLSYVGSGGTGSNFESTAPSAGGGNGSVSIVQYTAKRGCGGGTVSGFSGDQIVGTATFRVIAAGSATLAFKTTTTAVSSADNRTNVAPGRSPIAFSLVNPPTPTPAPTPAPNPQPNPQPNPGPGPAPTPRPNPGPTPPRTNPAPKPVTSITPSNSDTGIPTSNNDVTEVTTPIDVTPLPIQPDGINKIEYYLDNKLKATVKTPPYTYRLDTTKLLNGKYTLTKKTYYSNGQTKSDSQTIIVKNKFGMTQLRLRLQKMAWLIILLFLIAAAGIAAWVVHKRRGDGSDDYYDDGTYELDSVYGNGDDAPVVTPTATEGVQPGSTPPAGPSPYQQRAASWQPPATVQHSPVAIDPDQPITPAQPQPQSSPAPAALQQQAAAPQPGASTPPSAELNIPHASEPPRY